MRNKAVLILFCMMLLLVTGVSAVNAPCNGNYTWCDSGDANFNQTGAIRNPTDGATLQSMNWTTINVGGSAVYDDDTQIDSGNMSMLMTQDTYNTFDLNVDYSTDKTVQCAFYDTATDLDAYVIFRTEDHSSNRNTYIAVYNSQSQTKYVVYAAGDWITTTATRTTAWHNFTQYRNNTNDTTTSYIDGVQVNTVAGTGAHPIGKILIQSESLTSNWDDCYMWTGSPTDRPQIITTSTPFLSLNWTNTSDTSLINASNMLLGFQVNGTFNINVSLLRNGQIVQNMSAITDNNTYYFIENYTVGQKVNYSYTLLAVDGLLKTNLSDNRTIKIDNEQPPTSTPLMYANWTDTSTGYVTSQANRLNATVNGTFPIELHLVKDGSVIYNLSGLTDSGPHSYDEILPHTTKNYTYYWIAKDALGKVNVTDNRTLMATFSSLLLYANWTDFSDMIAPASTFRLNFTVNGTTMEAHLMRNGTVIGNMSGISSGTYNFTDTLPQVFANWTYQIITRDTSNNVNITDNRTVIAYMSTPLSLMTWIAPTNNQVFKLNTANFTFNVNGTFTPNGINVSLYRNDTIVQNMTVYDSLTYQFQENYTDDLRMNFTYKITSIDSNNKLNYTDNRTVHINISVPMVFLDWDKPTTDTQYNVNNLTFNFTVNGTYPVYANLYLNGTIRVNATVLSNEVYNMTDTYNGSIQDMYYYSIRAYSPAYGKVNHTANRSIYIDRVYPQATTTNKNKLAIYTRLFDAQFNFTDDFNIFSYVVALDGITITNKTGLTAQAVTLNLNMSFVNLSIGSHKLQVNASDGHTARTIKPYKISRNIMTNSLTYEFGQDWVKIYPETFSPMESFETEYKGDRYTWIHSRKSKSNTESYRIESTRPIYQVVNSSYKGHMIIPELNKWIDFENNEDASVVLTKISDYVYQATLVGVAGDNVYINSIGDLNTISQTYDFFIGNVTTTQVPTALETQPVTFRLDFNYNATFINNITANFSYGGTIYTPNTSIGADYYNMTVTFNAPNVPNNTIYTTYWEYMIGGINGTIYNRTNDFNQTVIDFNISECFENDTSAVLTLFPKDEETRLTLPNVSVEAFFEIFVDPTVKTNKTFEFSGKSNYTVCLNVNNGTVYSNAHFQYVKAEYSQRNYYLRNYSLDNTTDTVTLWLLNNSKSSDIILTLTDQNGDYVSNAYAYAYKYDVGTNTYQLVEVERSGYDGQAGFKLQLADALYSWVIKYNNIEYKNTIGNPAKLLSTTKFFTLNLKQDTLFYVKNIPEVDGVLTFNNATLTYTFTWSDPVGIVREGFLTIDKQGISRDLTICSNSSLGVAGTLTCQINESVYGNTYIGKAFFDTTSEHSNISSATLVSSFNDSFKRWGKTGLMSSVLLLVTIGAIFVSNGVAVIAGVLITFSGLMLMGIIETNFVILLTMAILGGIMIFRLKQ